MSSAVVFSSILHKKGRINKAWKRRFVTLDSACQLRYFKHEGDARPRNTLTVESVIDVPDIAGKSGRSLRFDVLCRENSRVLSLSAAQTDLRTRKQRKPTGRRTSACSGLNKGVNRQAF